MARALVKTISASPEDLQAKGLQLGDVKESLFDEATFQSVHGTSWILADGRSIVGSDLQALVGWTNAPDLRGVFLRGKDNGAGLNPDGDTALGTFQLDDFKSHTHGFNSNVVSNSSSGPVLTGSGTSVQSGAEGGDETRPKNVTVNFFIKINEE